MRLVEVARVLGMTGQDLRRELATVDFGVKPTDRDVPDQIAQGIIRYIARKHGIEVKVQDEAPEQKVGGADPPSSARGGLRGTRGLKVGDDQSEDEKEDEKNTAAGLRPAEVEKVEGGEQAKVHVLRKLTLEGVSDAAVQAHGRRVAASPRRRHAGVKMPPREKSAEVRNVVQEQIKQKQGVVELPPTITVKEFAEKTGIQVPKVIATLMQNGVLASMNQNIDFETAAIVAEELGVEVKRTAVIASAERLLAGNLQELLKDEDASLKKPRSPIVTVMGHVDHGKTAILDAIRKTDVVSGEAGGITQSIGATQVEHEGRRITFIDTPGHEAFTAMRARGAHLTDIVVLVVAADEGVKPTTLEAIAHARAAEVPIIVALNKIDRENADLDRVKGELAAQGLQPEEWGGTTPLVPCSAKTGQGINDLLETILIVAETAKLTANPDRSAVATVIESHLDSSLGPVASIIVNAGTLHLGETIVCGATFGRVKSMHDAHGDRLTAVPPSGAARIAGLSAVPETGDILQAVRDEQEARTILSTIRSAREQSRDRSLGDLVTRLSEGKMHILKIILKADAQGELQALRSSLEAMEQEKKAGGVLPKVIFAALGAVSESDVMMAAASDAIILGFNVTLPVRVEEIAAKHGVKVKLYDIIYRLLDDVASLLQGLVEPVEEERVLGQLEVKGVFFRKHNDQVIGGKVTTGILKRVPFRLLREGKEIGTGRITNIKHVDKDAKEGKEGQEYGLRVESATEILLGDVLEGFVKEFKKKA